MTGGYVQLLINVCKPYKN